MFHKTKNKNRKDFCKSCLQCFSSQNILAQHKQICLKISSKQSVKPGKGTFKTGFKQIPAPLKIFGDFE